MAAQAKAGKTLGDMRLVLTLDDKMVYILCNSCVVGRNTRLTNGNLTVQ